MELAFASLHQLCGPMIDRLRSASGAAAPGARDRLRAERRRGSGPVPRRARRAEPVLGGGRATPAAVRGRRRAVARSGVGADARLRRPPPAGGADRDRVRGARARPGARAPARVRRARPAQRGRPRAAELGGGLPARHAGPRPDHRRDARQPAGAARAAAGIDGDAAGGRLRAVRRTGSLGAHPAELRPAAPGALRRGAAPVAGRGGGAARRSAAAVARGRAARASRPRPRRRRRRRACWRSAIACGSGIRWRAPPSTGRRPRPCGETRTGRWRRRRIRTPIPTGGRGIAPRRRWASTRRWPASSSARPTGRRPAGARPRRRRSWRARPS